MKLEYTVKVQIKYPSPSMKVNSRDFSKTYSDKDSAYQYYNDLVEQYAGNELIFIKITLNEYHVDGTVKIVENVLESWGNMNE